MHVHKQSHQVLSSNNLVSSDIAGIKSGQVSTHFRTVIMFLSNYEVGNSLKVLLSDLVLHGEQSCGLEVWLSNYLLELLQRQFCRQTTWTVV